MTNTATTNPETLLFVDYENVGKLDLGVIPEKVQVMVFFGALQKSVPTEFMRAVHRLGSRFVPIDIEGQGKNALDFHIAYYLGERLAANPQADCIVLSKDKGFDVLVHHLKRRRFKVRSADSLTQAFPKPAPKAAARAPAAAAKGGVDLAGALLQAIEWLKSTQARVRPRKRKGLVAYLYTHFGKRFPESEVEQLVAAMIARKAISEADGKLAYHL
jgi:hypothetical protein